MRQKHTWSISIKLWLAMTILILVVLGGLGVAITWLFGDFYMQEKLNVLHNQAVELASELGQADNFEESRSMIRNLKLTSDTQLVLLDTQGEIIDTATNVSPMGPRGGWGSPFGGTSGHGASSWVKSLKPTDFLTQENLEYVLAGNTLALKASNQTGMTMLLAAAPVGEPAQGVVLMGSSLGPIQESTGAFRRLILYASLIAVLLATLVSLLIAKQLTRPLALMQKGASRMAQGDFQPIQGVTSQDELGELAEALNSMGQSLRNHVAWLSQEKNLLQGIVEGISDAVIMLGHDGRILYANDPAKALWQEDGVEHRGRKRQILSFLQEVSKLKPEEQPGQLTLGTQVLQVGMAVLAETDMVRGHVAVLRDVTASLRAEKERRDFLASVTHELRTPLHLIQGYLEAIQDGVIREQEQAEHIELVLDEAKRLARLVQELQDIHKLDAGQSLHVQPIDCDEFLQDLRQRFSGRAQELGIKLEIEGCTGELEADRDKLLQVFINLLDNALRHTAPGKYVQVRVEQREQEVIFMVQDQGEGMPSEALARVFDRFYRVDKSRSRKEGGMGLGLAIVRQIVEAHGGSVKVESELGRGSTFWVSLPKNSQPEA